MNFGAFLYHFLRIFDTSSFIYEKASERVSEAMNNIFSLENGYVMVLLV